VVAGRGAFAVQSFSISAFYSIVASNLGGPVLESPNLDRNCSLRGWIGENRQVRLY
jgi:hypothetical protein